MNKCQERGYHSWELISSIGETHESMEVECSCKDCGMSAEGTMYWN